MKLLQVLLITSFTVLAGPSVGVGSVQEEMRWRGWAPGGQVVEVNNVHGNVRAEASSGDEIEVIALKRGEGDPEGVNIEVVEHKGGVTICAVYPNASSDRPFECRPSHGGGFREVSASDSEAHIRWDNGGGGDVILNDLRVDFVVRLPKRLRFIGRTVDGEISTHLLEQDVEAHTVSGDVRVDMTPALGGEELRIPSGPAMQRRARHLRQRPRRSLAPHHPAEDPHGQHSRRSRDAFAVVLSKLTYGSGDRDQIAPHTSMRICGFSRYG